MGRFTCCQRVMACSSIQAVPLLYAGAAFYFIPYTLLIRPADNPMT
jgi:hypothetical protein